MSTTNAVARQRNATSRRAPMRRRLTMESLEIRHMLSVSLGYVPGELLVGFEGSVAETYTTHNSGPALQHAEELVGGHGLHNPKALAHRLNGPGRSARLTTLWQIDPTEDIDVAAERVAALPGVAYAEPNYIVTKATEPPPPAFPNDSRFSSLWGLDNPDDTDIDAPEAWGIHTGSGNTVVGVIDTGINYEHADLADNVWFNPFECHGELGACVVDGNDDDGNGYVDDFYGWDFVNDDNDPMADDQHGTHVSGTIGAVGDNGTGVAGVNWNVQLMALKFLDNNGSGSTADAIDALTYVDKTIEAFQEKGVDLNIAATNSSWGGGAFSQALMDAIGASGDHGLLFVAAAGNNRASAASYPALYDLDNIISVAASDDTGILASFSNHGTGVDLAAPGVDILSTMGNSCRKMSGTSMAAPHVTGAAALVHDLIGPSADYADVRDYLLQSVDTTDAAGQPLNLDVATGGRLNLANALKQVQMEVVSSSPADQDVLPGPLAEITLTFSQPIADGVSITGGELQVGTDVVNTGGTAIGNEATFTFDTDPFTTEGPYTVQLTPLGLTAIHTDKHLWDQAVQPWSATLYYDTTPLEVASVSTDSPADPIVNLPTDTVVVVTVAFNQEIDSETVGLEDLVLSQGVVTNAVAIDADENSPYKRAEYTVSEVTDESEWQILLPKGAVADLDGNPVEEYAETRTLDVTTRDFPTPLLPVAPEGSLIYERSEFGIINPAGDQDNFELSIDAGQTLSVVVRPESDWMPRIEIPELGIGPTSASVSGGSVVLQTIAIDTDTTVTLTVAAANGSNRGAYQLDVVLNAGVDEDGNLTTPQDISGSFIVLSPLASRGAIRGTLSPLVSAMSTENETGDDFLSKQNDLRGSWTPTSETQGGMPVWKINSGDGVTGRIGDRTGSGPFGSTDTADTWYLVAQEGDMLTFSAAGFSVDMHDATGDVIASGLKADGGTFQYTVPVDGDGIVEEIEYWVHVWDTKGDYALTIDRATTADLSPGDEKLDKFLFTTSPGDQLRMVGNADSNAGHLQFNLYDANGVFLDGSVPANRLDAFLEYTVPSGAADSTYRLDVFAETDQSPDAIIGYSVSILKNATFDLEPADSAVQVLPEEGGIVVGHLGYGQADVLWVGSHAQDWNDGDFSVTQVDLATFPADLTGHQVIYVDSNAGAPLDHASTISDFVSSGGGLVTENGGSEGSADYSWVPNADTGLAWVDQNDDVVHRTSLGMTHPVTAGIPDASLSNWSISVHNEFTNAGGMDVLTEDAEENASLLATPFNAPERLVYMGMDASGHLNRGESQRLIRQALRWAADPGTDVDRYQMTLFAGDLLDLDVAVPANGEGQYTNDLSPSLTLISPGGLPIDLGSLPHSVSALDSGGYTIEVSSPDDARGDYLLDVDVTKAPVQPAIVVSPTSGLVTTEAGGTDEFTIVLTTDPVGTVRIPVQSDLETEALVSTDAVTFTLMVQVEFTSANWWIPQVITVQGVDDSAIDGDITFNILTGAADATGTVYDGLPVPDVSVTNLDNDAPTAEVHVYAIDPSTIGIGGAWDVTISGAGFEYGASVILQSGSGPAPSVSDELFVDANTITATLTTSTGGPGRPRVWDVCVSNTGGATGCLVDGLIVDPNLTASMATALAVSPSQTFSSNKEGGTTTSMALLPDRAERPLDPRPTESLPADDLLPPAIVGPTETDVAFLDWELSVERGAVLTVGQLDLFGNHWDDTHGLAPFALREK